mgnify:CR=1 FL=1
MRLGSKREENTEEKKRKSRKKPLRKEVMEWVQILAVAAVLAFVINTFVIANSWVPSPSMENTIRAKSRVIGFRFSYLFEEPARGDVVIFKWPDNEEINYVKRIIGLPGETVTIVDGKVYIDGSEEPLDEPYILEPMVLPYYDRTSFPLTVDEGCLVVMGDNRNRSADSRYASIGQIEESQVIGKVLCILFPGCGESASRDFGRIGALDNG